MSPIFFTGSYAEALSHAGSEPNPYVLGVTVRAEVQARMMLGHFDDAQRSGEGALSWPGDRVPQTRSLILSTIAEELRRAGRLGTCRGRTGGHRQRRTRVCPRAR